MGIIGFILLRLTMHSFPMRNLVAYMFVVMIVYRLLRGSKAPWLPKPSSTTNIATIVCGCRMNYYIAASTCSLFCFSLAFPFFSTYFLEDKLSLVYVYGVRALISIRGWNRESSPFVINTSTYIWYLPLPSWRQSGRGCTNSDGQHGN